MERFNTDPLKQLRNRINHAKKVNIVLGAGDVWYGEDWIATNIEELDVVDPENWGFLFGLPVIDNILCEHVWEHLTMEQAHQANENIMAYLKPGGNFRLAVPDGLHPNPQYINHVKPGGTGAGAQDHKVLYNFVSVSRLLLLSGYNVSLLEYWDGDKNFNAVDWTTEKGKVKRSLRYDERNEDGQPNYTSLIVDAVKPMPWQIAKIKQQAEADINKEELFK
jgi:predicted SAM-dependent methyltransferase